MAKQTVKSGLVGKLGAKLNKAVEAHKGDETKFAGGGADLPAGIEMGIAQLVSCKFGTYASGDNEGEYFFMAQGVVITPKKHDGIPIEGLRTTIGPEPICDTPGRSRATVEDHVAWVLNEMRKLGVDTSELSADDLESTAEALVEQAPHFRFRTWQGDATPQYPNPRVNHQWNGVVEYDATEEGEVDDEVEDNTEDEETEETEEVEEESSEEQSLEELAELADNQDADAAATLNEKALEAGIEQDDIDSAADWAAVVTLMQEAEEGGEEAEEESEEAETEDLAAMGMDADAGDEAAIDRLTELANENGLDPDDGETYPDWETLATAIEEAINSEGEEEEEFVPEKGSVYYYTPPGKKKPVEVEVTLVGKSTVSCKGLDDQKIYKNVPYDQLSVE